MINLFNLIPVGRRREILFLCLKAFIFNKVRVKRLSFRVERIRHPLSIQSVLYIQSSNLFLVLSFAFPNFRLIMNSTIWAYHSVVETPGVIFKKIISYSGILRVQYQKLITFRTEIHAINRSWFLCPNCKSQSTELPKTYPMKDLHRLSAEKMVKLHFSSLIKANGSICAIIHCSMAHRSLSITANNQ